MQRNTVFSRLAPALGVLAVWIPWFWAMTTGGRWGLFATHGFMTPTMVLGSFVAGATSEGGGAVAFPVMTLAYGIAPGVARDFSLMIQAVGMTAAAITIFWSRVRVVVPALIWASVGGAIGIVAGLEAIAPRVHPAYAKMLFTSTWLAFALALYWINRLRGREVRRSIVAFRKGDALELVCVGLLGGVVSSITGSGIDIMTFSLLVLRFRISEGVATPTSVALMGINAAVGALWRGGVRGELAPEAMGYWWVCVPVVVIGAPFGARFIRRRGRRFVAQLLQSSIVLQFVAALAIVPQTPRLVGFSAAVFAIAAAGFFRMTRRGALHLERRALSGGG